jgi:hypothetical protein
VQGTNVDFLGKTEMRKKPRYMYEKIYGYLWSMVPLAVIIKFSGNLDSGSETVTSTSFETPY